MRQTLILKLRRRVNWRLARSARRVHGRGPLLVAIGDSHTDPGSGNTLPWQVWLRMVGRQGYRTVNLGVSGDTTADMRRRIEQTVSEGRPEIVVLFGGANDAVRRIDPADTARDVAFMVAWLRDRGIPKIVLIGPGMLNGEDDADSVRAVDDVRAVFRDVADRHGATFVDLAGLLRARIERGEDPDFSRVRYRQSRSWHVEEGDGHFNAYGQRLIAEAFLAATVESSTPPRDRRLLPSLR